jgi:hypothetical protein|tara:strand:- start:302 stop:487 length:186 start_codon:yes stop_codon:yes gene_type:complete
MKEKQQIDTHITIEEAISKGLWRIVRQLKMDMKARQGLGLKSLQEAIKTPGKKAGRPKIHK